MSQLDYGQNRSREPEIIPPGQSAPPPQRSRARFPVTTSFIGINIAVFLLMLLNGVSPANPTPREIVRWGADYGPLTLGPEPWRLITSVFLHIGIIHIAANMWALWQLGALAELIFGPYFYLVIYLLAGVAGNVSSLAMHPNVPGAGASGAIFGLAGATIAVLKLGKLPVPKNALRGILQSLVIFVIINIGIVGRIPGVDNAAHIGGFLCGLLLGALLSWSRFVAPENRPRLRWASIVVVAAVLWAGFTAIKRNYHPPEAAVARHDFAHKGIYPGRAGI